MIRLITEPRVTVFVSETAPKWALTMMAEMQSNIMTELRTVIRDELHNNVLPKLRADMKAELHNNVLPKLRADMKAELHNNVLPKLRAELRADMKAEISAQLAPVLKRLDEHSRILKEHSAILKEHSRILKEHSAILKEHSAQIKDLKAEIRNTRNTLSARIAESERIVCAKINALHMMTDAGLKRTRAEMRASLARQNEHKREMHYLIIGKVNEARKREYKLEDKIMSITSDVNALKIQSARRAPRPERAEGMRATTPRRRPKARQARRASA